MPIRWSTSQTKASSPLFRVFLSSITKSSQQQTQSAKSALKPPSRSFQSTRPSNQSLFTNLSSLASVSKSIALAGTGTFMSTLFALYLATKVESLAHETLYEYFPNKYYSINEEELPSCIADKEMIRRRTGQVCSERVQGRKWDDSYLSLDGFVIPEERDVVSVGAAELLAEEILEVENSKMTLWQRERIIQEEEREFKKEESWLGLRPLWGEGSVVASANKVANGQLVERKRLQEEMARKFQEKLMSTAMTA